MNVCDFLLNDNSLEFKNSFKTKEIKDKKAV